MDYRVLPCSRCQYYLQIYRREINIDVVFLTFLSWSMACIGMLLKAFLISIIINLDVEETEEPGENHRPVASHWQTLLYNVV